MKHTKRFLALILIAVFCVTPLLMPPVAAANTDMRYGRAKLNADLQVIYDALVDGCADAKAEIKIDVRGRNIDFSKDLNLAYIMFHKDYPEYFWVTGGWKASYNQNSVTMKPQYNIPGGNLATAKAQYNAKVAELTSGVTGSDYQKAKLLHDRLIAAVTYVSTSNDQNAYGALVEGKAVCSGYTRAYQHLLNTVGIPSWYVTGNSMKPDSTASVSHAWNLVKLDGAWYYTDVTWDDQGNNTFYAYFNITTQRLLKDHTFSADDAAYLPQATATAANYYKIENCEFTSYDQQKLVELLKKDGHKTQIYVDGDVKAFQSAINANLLAIGRELGGAGSFSISSSHSTLGNAVILKISLTSQDDHTHAATTFVKQVDADCRSNGKKAYYVCGCGARFFDQACQNPVADENALTIPATAHTPSGYKNDRENHWRECTRCHTVIASSREKHRDQNGDHLCDVCSYAMPTTPSGGSSNVPETTGTPSGGSSNVPETTGTPSGGNTPEVTQPPATQAPENTTQQPDDGNTPTVPSQDSDTPSEDIDKPSDTGSEQTSQSAKPATPGTATPDSAPQGRDLAEWNGILGGAMVVVAGVSAAVILRKKKKP